MATLNGTGQVTSNDKQQVYTELDLLTILAKNNNSDNMRNSSNLHNVFYSPGQDDKQSVFGGEDAMSVYSGVNSSKPDSVAKMVYRIWSGYTKFIRSQCNKDRVIDSQYFGSFARKPVDNQEQKYSYVLVNDPQANESFKILSGPETFNSLPGFAVRRETAAVNHKAIGQVCLCSGEQVHSLLNKLRDLAVSLSRSKKKMVNLNFLIGTLCFYPNGTVEFKSINSNEKRGNRLLSQEAKMDHSKEANIKSLLKSDQKGNEYGHLSSFLQNQIVRKTEKVQGKADTISQISKKNRANNTLIEKAAMEIQLKKVQTATLAQSEGKLEKLQSLQKAFFSPKQVDKIEYQTKDKDVLSQTGSIHNSIAARSYLSKRLSQRSNRSVTHFRNQTNSQMERLNTQAATQDNGDNIFQAKNVPRNSISNLSKGDRNVRTQSQGRQAYNLTERSAFGQTSPNYEDNQSQITSIIRGALDRKQISNNFHSQAYPYFFRSQGPFKVYDHAQAKGQSCVQNLQAINDQAHTRFREECEKIKEVREFEREQFDWQKKKQDIIANHNANMKQKNNLENLQQLAAQIENDRQRKQQFNHVEKKYYKPHFGPEETDETCLKDLQKTTNMKNYVHASLQDQINLKHNLQASKMSNENKQDLINLEQAKNMFVAEERALQAKNIRDKLANKANWEGQMEDRLHKKTMDQLFY